MAEASALDTALAALSVVSARNRANAALAYSYLIGQHRGDRAFWGFVNSQIQRRWSTSGLNAIKTEAWRLLGERGKGGAADGA